MFKSLIALRPQLFFYILVSLDCNPNPYKFLESQNNQPVAFKGFSILITLLMTVIWQFEVKGYI